MAKRFQGNSHTTGQVPAYYMNNGVYPGSYTRNDYPTRVSRRVHDGLTLDRQYGLDTTSDDVNSSPYSSPYYVNGRYNSSNLTTQRGNSASVQGIERLTDYGTTVSDFDDSDIQTAIEMWQGKQIKFVLPYNGKVVGNTITLKNTDACTGILSIYFSTTENGQPIYETAIDLCDISQDKFEHKVLYSATPVPRGRSANSKLYVRMEIWGEIAEERNDNPFNTGRKIEIAATGLGNHDAAVVRLGNKNEPLEEKYDYVRLPNRPCMGLAYNSWVSVPTSRNEAAVTGATVSLNGYRYDVFCIKNETEAKVLIYDKQMNRFVEDVDINVDGRVKELYIIQAKDLVYYVDGYSPVQKFKIGEWASTALPISTSDTDNNPVIAPSIITFHNNRIYLAGFRYDTNLIQFTEITGNGPAFESFPYRAYVPDESPLATSANPITAVVEYESDTLMIAGKTFFSLYRTDGTAAGATAETAMPSQVTIYTDGGGVQEAGDICNYHGVLYSFDQDEGLRRFTGALWNKIPASVDSHIERVDMSKPRKLWGYANKLYFNYTDKIDGKYKCLVWDMDMNYQQFPWFMDIDAPFCDIRADDDYDLVGIHPDYPCIMHLYAQDVWRRLDTPITFERHTKFISLPGNSADMILKRVHNKVLANSNRWWWVGLTYDKHVLDQVRGKVTAYRIPCWATANAVNAVEDPFNESDVYEEDAVSLLSVTNIRTQAISAQVRIKTKTFRSQASLISTVLEAQPRQYR